MKMLNRRSWVLVDMICMTCSSKAKFGVRSEFKKQEVGHAREDDTIAVVSVRIYSKQKKLASGVTNGGTRALLAPGGSEQNEPNST